MNASTSSSERGKYVQSNGLCMYYEAQGAGTPVILLHGGLETCQMWAPVIPALSMHCQVITPDSRAHGRTDNPSGQFSYPLMAEDIALLIEALELHRPFVVGYSDGGQTALQMAITYPGLAQGYLIGAVYYSITTEWRQMMQGILGIEGSGRVDIERVIQTNPEFVRSLEAKHDAFHESGYWKSLFTQVSQAWWEPPMLTQAAFAKITDPALFWCGDRDLFCPPEQSLDMYRMVSTAELAIVPNADHFTMAQQLDVAAMILLNFITRWSA
ncbi:MAG: alpha/beta hydrolase [Anaerolineae bacterium]|nr:alpha/beta hydrolase [Anaerolineae bacterium]